MCWLAEYKVQWDRCVETSREALYLTTSTASKAAPHNDLGEPPACIQIYPTVILIVEHGGGSCSLSLKNIDMPWE